MLLQFQIKQPGQIDGSVSVIIIHVTKIPCMQYRWFNSGMSYTSPTPRQRFMKALAICIPSVYDQCMIIELLLTRDCSLEMSKFACMTKVKMMQSNCTKVVCNSHSLAFRDGATCTAVFINFALADSKRKREDKSISRSHTVVLAVV